MRTTALTTNLRAALTLALVLSAGTVMAQKAAPMSDDHASGAMSKKSNKSASDSNKAAKPMTDEVASQPTDKKPAKPNSQSGEMKK